MTSALEIDGDIVWFPAPRFDSRTVFAGILGSQAGNFSVRPRGRFVASSSYLGDSLALQTTFSTAQGRLRLIDFLPLNIPAIFRIYDSDIEFIADIRPVFDYGKNAATVSRKGRWLVFSNVSGRDGLEIAVDGRHEARGRSLSLSKGKGCIMAFYSEDVRNGLSARGDAPLPDPLASLRMYTGFWGRSVAQAKRPACLQKAYRRSISVVLGCIYLPSGAAIAAPTASLPETAGGQRNWDYRYCWIRDSSYTAQALAKAGLLSLSRNALSFMAGLAGTRPTGFMHPLYTVDGGTPQSEEELGWLEGYRGSRPVRVGNAAATQVQPDCLGSFMSALYTYFRVSGDRDFIGENWRAVKAISGSASASWRKKSSSLWEEREEPRHYVFTKVMEWVAIDRASRLSAAMGLPADAERLRKAAGMVMDDVMSKGFSAAEGSFVKYYGSSEVDASLLALPLYGFIRADDKRFTATMKRIVQELGTGYGMLRRYKSDWLGDTESSFTLLSFWLARVHLRLGNGREAMRIVRMMVRRSTSLGLMPEHMGPEGNEYSGNFPQLFPHSALIETLAECSSKGLTGLS